ncbi:hypothetical protein EPN18_00305 [bacterium]|nr:MAG: hypothetical protein EPN18_00305 [bacterium]
MVLRISSWKTALPYAKRSPGRKKTSRRERSSPSTIIYPGENDLARFGVRLTKSAAGDLDAAQDKMQIISDIGGLCDNPLPTGVNIKKLKAFNPPLYRLRLGNYRVLYRIEGLVVTIMRVIDRKELEKTIKRIRKSS